MHNLLINIVVLITCGLIGFVCCGALNVWYHIVRYNKVRIEYFYAVGIGFVSIGCNVLLLFLLIELRRWF